MHGAEIERAVIGIRSRIDNGTQHPDSLVLGADYYETADEVQNAAAAGLPPLGIGADSVIERAIIDKNARIGRGVRIVNEAGIQASTRRTATATTSATASSSCRRTPSSRTAP